MTLQPRVHTLSNVERVKEFSSNNEYDHAITLRSMQNSVVPKQYSMNTSLSRNYPNNSIDPIEHSKVNAGPNENDFHHHRRHRFIFPFFRFCAENINEAPHHNCIDEVDNDFEYINKEANHEDIPSLPSLTSLSIAETMKSGPSLTDMSIDSYTDERKAQQHYFRESHDSQVKNALFSQAPASILRKNGSFSSTSSFRSIEFVHNKTSNTAFENTKEGKTHDSLCRKSTSAPMLLNNIHDPPQRRKSTGILGRSGCTIRFDPKVGVREFKKSAEESTTGSAWWTAKELEAFKDEAIARIHQKQNECAHLGGAFYNHPALGISDEEEVAKENFEEYLSLARSELKSILIVDPHDMFLKLFTKSLKTMLPHAEITTSQTVAQALRFIEERKRSNPPSKGGPVHGFDIILAEERLQGIKHGRLNKNLLPSEARNSQRDARSKDSYDNKSIITGSDFFKRLSHEEEEIRKTWLPSSKTNCRFSLLIGVSAHLEEDEWSLKKSGVSFVWGKPPPRMNYALRDKILKTISEKRNRKDISYFFEE